MRRVSSVLVVAIGLLYLIPQFQGAGLTLRTLTGAPSWVGQVAVAVVVCLNVLPGGMRSVTLIQAFHYWLKLVALLTPMFFFAGAWATAQPPGPTGVGAVEMADWVEPLQGDHALYLTYSLVLATFFGTMGLPHVVVRFYTNRDGRAARRTTLVVLVLLAAFYVMPVLYGVLGRMLAFDLVAEGRADTVVLELPSRVFDGALGAGPHGARRCRRLRRVPVDLDRPRRLGRRVSSARTCCAGAPGRACGAAYGRSGWRRCWP